MSAETASELRRDRLKLVDAKAETAQPADPATAREAREPQAKEAPPAAEAADTKAKKSPLKRGLLTVAAVAASRRGLFYGYRLVDAMAAYDLDRRRLCRRGMATVAPKITGYVSRVSVAENTSQGRRRGSPLDDGDYRIALDRPAPRSRRPQAALARIGEQIKAGEAAVEQAQAQLPRQGAAIAGADFERQQALAAESFSLRQRSTGPAERDRRSPAGERRAALDSAAGQRRACSRRSARPRLAPTSWSPSQGGARSRPSPRSRADRRRRRQPAVRRATTCSPASGFALVPLDAVYVDANFKETQLGACAGPDSRGRGRCPAGRTLRRHVESIAPARARCSPAAARERDRQLHQDRAARAGAFQSYKQRRAADWI